ncbi:MAG: dipicolinate synthase subunit DpsA [Peptococcaceae bacterium]
MFHDTIAVLGGDARQKWLARTLERHHLLSAVYAVPDYIPASSQIAVLDGPDQLSVYTCIAAPVPLARNAQVTMPPDAPPLSLALLVQILTAGQRIAGGNLPAAFQEQCRNKQIITHDYLQSEPLALGNAAITAEGMLAVLLECTPYTLQNTAVLLLGYGRCGLLLAQKLQVLGSVVTICEIDPARRALARAQGFATLPPQALPTVLSDCELIVNTAPAPVLTADLIRHLPASAMLFDLASSPGGICQQAAEARGLFYRSCPGLPGSSAPQTAGELLAEDLLRFLGRGKPPGKDDGYAC